MSNLSLNSTATTQQQQLLLQQQQQQALDAQTKGTNAGGDQGSGGSVAVPDDKDPDSYRLAYQNAINEGRTPDAAAKAAYKNAAPRVNGEEGAHGEENKARDDRQSTQAASSKDAASGGRSNTAEGPSGGQKTVAQERTNASENTQGATNAPRDTVDTGNTRSRSLVSVPNGSGADVATGSEPKAGNPRSLQQITDIATDPGANDRTVQTSRAYSNMVDNGVPHEKAEVAATNTYVNLEPDENGTVDGGTVGPIDMGDTRSRLATATPEQRTFIQSVTQQLVQNPELVKTLANTTNTKEIQDTLNQSILDGTLEAMSGTDDGGNKKGSITGGGSGGKSAKKSMSLNPMELVMVAMMQAAIEGQKQAKSLADDVQTNTDTKRQLRESKSALGEAIRADGATPGQSDASTDSSKSSGGAGVKRETPDINKLTGAQPSTNGDKTARLKENQTTYDQVSNALDDAGDDSSILMIKLQTASQIVTTFLQACSNVSKGVTDTTKAVIGNIGH